MDRVQLAQLMIGLSFLSQESPRIINSLPREGHGK
jgi:hypothetical protein